MQENNQKNYYMINMQKVLFVARELHKRGYEKLRVIPSLSPTGLAWRCKYVVSNEEKQYIIVSNWIYNFFQNNEKEIIQSTKELTDLLENEDEIFFIKCKGKNQEYVTWYSKMLDRLEEGELPYAFSDYFSSNEFWETSLKNKIKILPDEYQYYH
jgi:hypothetical protein